MFERELCVVVCSPASRDTIYVGIVTALPSGWLKIERAVNVVSYGKPGVPGMSQGPEGCHLSQTSGKCLVYQPIQNIAQVVPVPFVRWEKSLPVPDGMLLREVNRLVEPPEEK